MDAEKAPKKRGRKQNPSRTNKRRKWQGSSGWGRRGRKGKAYARPSFIHSFNGVTRSSPCRLLGWGREELAFPLSHLRFQKWRRKSRKKKWGKTESRVEFLMPAQFSCVFFSSFFVIWFCFKFSAFPSFRVSLRPGFGRREEKTQKQKSKIRSLRFFCPRRLFCLFLF